MKHSPEPWRIEEIDSILFNVKDASNQQIELSFDEHCKNQYRMNAERIVLCVNACAGISNEDLKKAQRLVTILHSSEVGTRSKND